MTERREITKKVLTPVRQGGELRQGCRGPELRERGEWMCWRPGEESFEHVARAAR